MGRTDLHHVNLQIADLSLATSFLHGPRRPTFLWVGDDPDLATWIDLDAMTGRGMILGSSHSRAARRGKAAGERSGRQSGGASSTSTVGLKRATDEERCVSNQVLHAHTWIGRLSSNANK